MKWLISTSFVENNKNQSSFQFIFIFIYRIRYDSKYVGAKLLIIQLTGYLLILTGSAIT